MFILFAASLVIFLIPFIFDSGVFDGNSGIARNLVRFGIGGGGDLEDAYGLDDRLDSLAAEIDGDFGVRFNATEFAASVAADDATGGDTAVQPSESDFTAEDQEPAAAETVDEPAIGGGAPAPGAVAAPGDSVSTTISAAGATGSGANSRVAGETAPDEIFSEIGLTDAAGITKAGEGDEYEEGEDSGGGGGGGGGGDVAGEASLNADAGSGDDGEPAKAKGGKKKGGKGKGGGASGGNPGPGDDNSGDDGATGGGGSGGGASEPGEEGDDRSDLAELDAEMRLREEGASSGTGGGSGDGDEEAAAPGTGAANVSLPAAGAAPGLASLNAASWSKQDLLELVPQDIKLAPLRTKKISGYEWPATNLSEVLGFEDVPPPGMDAQVWRDFRPWRTRGFTMRDIIHTRARKTVLLTEKTEFSHEIFTTVIKDGVPYYLTSEMRTLAHYKVARLLKLLDFILQLHSVGKKYPLPDVYLVWTVLPNPLLRARHVKDLVHAPPGVAPILSLCKTDHDLDVVYPNMYFRTLGWWTKVTRGLSQAAAAMPFHKRKPRMWWRGSSGGTWPAARPRVLSVSRWFMKSWADFAFTNMWTSVWRRWRRNQWRVHVPRNAMAIPFGGEKQTPIHSVARYKYTFHLPGSFSGTYSRALQFLLWTGTAIFFYDCPYYEFYYHHMKPWVHFIPANHENLGQRMEWAVNHPKSTERIAAESRGLARSVLTAEFLASYWKQLLDEYARLQKFKVELPDDACTCWRGDQKKPPPYLPRKTKRCPYLCDVIQYV